MTNAQTLKRQKAVAAAIGSVRAEGLQPSSKTKNALKDYARGNITIDEVRKRALRNITSK